MPSSAENIELEAGSSPSSSRQRDPGGEDVASRHVRNSVHSGGPAPLDAVVVSDPVDGDDENDESDATKDEFRPGYEEGLLVILQRYARLVVSKRRREKFEESYGPLNPHYLEEDENLKWARTTLSAIKNRDGKRDKFLPELPTDVSHPLLRRIVFQVNQRRHMSICRGRRGSPERFPMSGLSKGSMPALGLLLQADPPGSAPSMTSRLFKSFRSLSGHTDQQQEWQSLKTIADDVTRICPLQGSLRATVCDFGDGAYDRFDTTLDLVTNSESSEDLYLTPRLRMLMVTRNYGKAGLGESPLDVRLSAA